METAQIQPPANQSPHPALLFLGCERSGTTFVQHTLEQYYDVAEGNESAWIIKHWRRLQKHTPKTQREQERFITAVFSEWYFANMSNYHQVHFNHHDFIQHGPFDYPKFVQQVFQHIANTKGKTWVLNKTCGYCSDMPIVDQVFHNPNVVHIIRDGRDIALSLLEVPNWGPKTIYGAAKWWADRVDKMQHHAQQHMQGRYAEIRYEDLLENPAQTFETITKQLGIFDPQRHHQLTQSITIKHGNSEKWRAQLTPKQIAIFERVAGHTLQRNGYTLDTPQHQLRPYPKPVDSLLTAREAIVSRVGLYPLWFRTLKLINKTIGKFPKLQHKFFRSQTFANHFHWNKIRKKIDQKKS